MVVLVNAATEPLVIRPTHRLLRTVDPVRLRALVQGPDPLFQAVPVAPEALADRDWRTCATRRKRCSGWSCPTERAG